MSHRLWTGAVGLVVFAVTIMSVGSAAHAETLTQTPSVMAHKGLHTPYGPAPENSVGAIVDAAELGVPTEIDIVFSKPTQTSPYGVPFVFHDLTLKRMTNRKGYLSAFTPWQLAHICLVSRPHVETCSAYKIPRLMTVLKQTRAAHGALDIEIKNENLTADQAGVIVNQLERADAWTWDMLPGFDSPLIMSTWVQPLELVRSVAASRVDEPLVTEILCVEPDYSDAKVTGSAMESVWYKNINPDAVLQLHSLGLLVDAFTSNHAEDWNALAGAGVDWVISDDVVEYQNWAEARTPS